VHLTDNGNTNETPRKHHEILEFAYDVAVRAKGWEKHVDDDWNTGIMKMGDNAIILAARDSSEA
jgi:hypothetical protein